MRNRIFIALVILSVLSGILGCSASQTQVFQEKIFAWDDQNVETARKYAMQIKKHWLYNYKVIEEFLGGKLGTEDYANLKRPMDKIKLYVDKVTLTEEEVAVINISFGKFLTVGGEKLIKDGLPELLKFIDAFKLFFGL